MGGRELLNRKSIYRTALLKNEFRTLAVRASDGSRKFELQPPANRPNDPNLS
jgi:hypothetical protein